MPTGPRRRRLLVGAPGGGDQPRDEHRLQPLVVQAALQELAPQLVDLHLPDPLGRQHLVLVAVSSCPGGGAASALQMASSRIEGSRAREKRWAEARCVAEASAGVSVEAWAGRHLN